MFFDILNVGYTCKLSDIAIHSTAGDSQRNSHLHTVRHHEAQSCTKIPSRSRLHFARLLPSRTPDGSQNDSEVVRRISLGTFSPWISNSSQNGFVFLAGA